MSDIKVLNPLPDSRLVRTRLSLSQGTMRPDDRTRLSRNYCRDIIVPKGPWQEMSMDEDRALRGETSAPGAWVQVLRVQDECLRDFRWLHREIREGTCEAKILELTQSRECIRGVDRVSRYMAATMRDVSQLEGGGISVKHPGLITCTINNKTKQYVGLHVDTFYAQELRRRPESPGRMCINIGIEDRSFLFVNLTLQTMANLLERKGRYSAENCDSGKALAIAFLDAFPDYPVVRLRLAPGEAYLAPTENIVHDGATDEQRYWDVTLTVRGHFGPVQETRSA